MSHLEQLPARVDALGSQVSHLHTEMRAEFSALRSQMAAQGETITATLRQEMAAQGETITATLRQEMAAQRQTIITTLRQEMAAQGAALRGEIHGVRDELQNVGVDLATQMRVLHEDIISRIALLQEDRPQPPKRRPWRKR